MDSATVAGFIALGALGFLVAMTFVFKGHVHF